MQVSVVVVVCGKASGRAWDSASHFQIHATDRALAGFWLANLWMHGAAVDLLSAFYPRGLPDESVRKGVQFLIALPRCVTSQAVLHVWFFSILAGGIQGTRLSSQQFGSYPDR